MDRHLGAMLRHLYCSGRLDELNQSIEALRQEDPNHPQAMFYGAMVHLQSQGQEVRQTIFSLFNMLALNMHHIASAEDGAMISYLGYSALLLARLSESQLSTFDTSLLSYINGAVSIAHVAGQIIRDTSLQEEALRMERRLRTLGNPTEKTAGYYLSTPSPLLLQVEPTNHCNLQCIMCPRKEMTRPIGFLPPATLERILETWQGKRQSFALIDPLNPSESIIDFFVNRTVKLFFMGEPLAHPQLEALLEIAQANHCILSIQTNGLLLEKASVRRKLLEHGPLHLAISIDGAEASSYNALRKGSDWQRLQRAVETFHQERKAVGMEKEVRLFISTMVSEVNTEHKQRALRFLELLEPIVDKVEIILLDRDANPEFVNEKGEVARYERTSRPPCPANTPLCFEPLYKLNILWDGTITACCTDYDGRLVLGSVFDEGGIDGAWQGERVRRLQEAILTHNLEGFPLCQQCQVGAVPAPVSQE